MNSGWNISFDGKLGKRNQNDSDTHEIMFFHLVMLNFNPFRTHPPFRTKCVVFDTVFVGENKKPFRSCVF